MDGRPIGVFDSGLGGLTVLQAIVDLLPHEHTVYFGDTARYPYGPRRAGELIAFSRQIGDLLLGHDVKIVVVACNSASAAALDDLREYLPVPVIGVVEPGVRAVATVCTSGRAAVLGTQMTADSHIYERTAERLGVDVRLETLACPGFVELVESGQADSDEARLHVRDHLAQLGEDVDTVVLGCTHYPLLGRVLSEHFGPSVALVSSADETAFEVRDLLERMGWNREATGHGRRRFITSGDASRFAGLGERFLGWPLGPVDTHAWPSSSQEAG